MLDPMLLPDVIHDRVAGCIFGLALGDALGAPFEGGLAGRVYMAGYRAIRRERLTYTDDTEMMIAVVESLLSDRGVDQEELAGRFARNCSFGRGYGAGARKTLSMIKRGVPWRQASMAVFSEGSHGNGAAMRAAPVGLLHAGNATALRRAAQRQAEITHAHPLGKEGAVLMAHAAAHALLSSNPCHSGYELFESLISVTATPAFRRKIQIAAACLSETYDSKRVVRDLGHGVAAIESVPTAIYLFARFSDDFERAVHHAIQLRGDTDTIAAMTGALVGAHVGKGALPQERLATIENRLTLETLADGFGRAVTTNLVRGS